MNIQNQLPELKVTDLALFDDRVSYFNPSKLFFAYFKSVPSNRIIFNINNIQVIKWIEQNITEHCLGRHTRKEYDYETRQMKNTDTIFLFNKMLIYVDNRCLILCDACFEKKAEEIILRIKKFKQKYHARLSILSQSDCGLKLLDIKNNKPKMTIQNNYNDDLVDLHKMNVANLKKKDGAGLYLFHGQPGTGKSTYIRYLINDINKRVIFLPPKLAGNMDDPSFVKILIAEKNAVLVIEDAENLLASREKGNNSAIAMLLNITDGLLGESLGIQVICTFNCKLDNIDKALLRKGRLKALYEFKKLSVTKSITLLENLGITDIFVEEPMTLADIFNTHEQNFATKIERKSIGFALS